MYLLGKNGPGTIFWIVLELGGKSQVLVFKIYKFKHFYYTEDTFCMFICSPFISGSMKPKDGRQVLMVFPSIGWYKNFICCFATLGLTEGNLNKTLISKPILKLKHSIHIFIHQIVNEVRNHHQMRSSLLTSFTCTKCAQDKHNVPASKSKVFSLSDIHLSQT